MKEIFLRRSVRDFKEEELSNDSLYHLVEAGFAAPTARNQSSRAFVIINDKAILDELSTVSPGARVLKKAVAAIAVIGVNPEELITREMQECDLGAATENILIEATANKIGSCWIGIYPIEDRVKKANQVLGVNNNDFVYSLIALGYPLSEDAFFDKQKTDINKIYWNRVK